MNLSRIITLLLCLSLITACESRVERDFKKGCAIGGADSSICSCVYDKMKDHYSEDIMTHMGQPGSQMPDDFSDVMVKSAMQCRDEH
jgi:hypothetical protein